MQAPRTESTVPFDRNDPLVRLFLAYARLLARYHQHRVLHLERLGSLLRKGRRVVLVGNHVLDVLDPLLFTAALIDRYGRLPHFIGHENLRRGTHAAAHRGLRSTDLALYGHRARAFKEPLPPPFRILCFKP